MSAQPDGISRRAGSLLFDILEQREPVLSSLIMREHFPALGQKLRASGLLRRWGSELADVAGDLGMDQPVTVLPSPNGEGLGFFSGISGWVEVPPERLSRYRVDIPAAIAAIAGRLRWCGKFKPSALIEDDIWELGTSRMLTRGAVTEVWFARRLRHQNVLEALKEFVQRRPSAHGLRLVLTSTPGDAITGLTLPRHVLVSIRDILGPEDGLAVHPDLAAARIRGTLAFPTNEAIYLSPDSRTLIINGTARILFRSRIHIEIIEQLVEAYRANRGCSTAELLEGSDSQSKSLDQAFGPKWKVLRPYLKWEAGAWRFAV
jgi:hypothetical protein